MCSSVFFCCVSEHLYPGQTFLPFPQIVFHGASTRGHPIAPAFSDLTPPANPVPEPPPVSFTNHRANRLFHRAFPQATPSPPSYGHHRATQPPRTAPPIHATTSHRSQLPGSGKVHLEQILREEAGSRSNRLNQLVRIPKERVDRSLSHDSSRTSPYQSSSSCV
ncbi:hypothetical protein E2542_SST19309 [Spatholobus suberectus]|nr:hypothetical protein E2542_SST19309 [Spatholobus suberectus]